MLQSSKNLVGSGNCAVKREHKQSLTRRVNCFNSGSKRVKQFGPDPDEESSAPCRRARTLPDRLPTRHISESASSGAGPKKQCTRLLAFRVIDVAQNLERTSHHACLFKRFSARSLFHTLSFIGQPFWNAPGSLFVVITRRMHEQNFKNSVRSSIEEECRQFVSFRTSTAFDW